MPHITPHEAALAALNRKGRLRALTPRTGRNFTSNDYLGLAESEALRTATGAALARGVPLGAGGSRLLRGNHPEHEALEAEAAAFFGSETSLFFPTGFAANAALLETLPRHDDLIIHDALIHASVRAGLDPARVKAVETPHNDVTAIEDAIRRWRAGGGKGRAWITAETLYSMDGDRAPLNDLMALADATDSMLLLDEAHATGVYGEQGRGLAAQLEGRPNVILLHTCGKALGAAGALICLPKLYRDFLVNRAAGFIYSTAPSPLMAAVIRAVLPIVAQADAERARLAALVAHARKLLAKHSLKASGSQIQPIILGTDVRATTVAQAMQARGYDVRAIRPPTVPEGTARLRLSITVHADEAALDEIFAVLVAELEQA
ncbi:MAG: 8-amino-7-oxononanoate synthase [Alphaproteobacteria bacterium]|nr:8-amino-7-oxononanoate synthase [Alphaproteobacteria bacterium]